MLGSLSSFLGGTGRRGRPAPRRRALGQAETAAQHQIAKLQNRIYEATPERNPGLGKVRTILLRSLAQSYRTASRKVGAVESRKIASVVMQAADGRIGEVQSNEIRNILIPPVPSLLISGIENEMERKRQRRMKREGLKDRAE